MIKKLIQADLPLTTIVIPGHPAGDCGILKVGEGNIAALICILTHLGHVFFVLPV